MSQGIRTRLCCHLCPYCLLLEVDWKNNNKGVPGAQNIGDMYANSQGVRQTENSKEWILENL